MQTSTTASQRTAYLHDKAYQAVALTHFFVDILNNSRTLLVALLAIVLGLTNAQVGIALLLYNVGSALSQPFFGLWADRVGPRWFIVGGMAWMVSLYGFAAVASDWAALIAITLAGFGSGAFHPTGTMVASDRTDDSQTRATAFFFTAGQLGLFLGPILAGVLLDRFGRIGYIILPASALFAVIGSYLHVHNPKRTRENVVAVVKTVKGHIPWAIVIALVWLMLLLNTVSIATINFAPKLFAELGYSAAYAGAMSGLWMLGSAFGVLVGGWIGDRSGNRIAITIGLLGAVLPLYFYIPADDVMRMALLAIAGFFGGMPHSILVLGAQWVMPGRRATASGLALGFMFMGGALGSYAVGVVADNIGLATTLQWLSALLVLSVLAVPFMPKRYTTRPS
jgi:FSR family fosmidomycin resistance protein-like MFS transporter